MELVKERKNSNDHSSSNAGLNVREVFYGDARYSKVDIFCSISTKFII